MLAVLTVVLEAEIPQVAALREAVIGQARFLGTPQGIAALHFVQCNFAFVQGSVSYVLAGLVTVVAVLLQLLVWYTRGGTIGSDSTGLIAGQMEPLPMLPTDPRNMHVIMQNL